MAISLAIIAAIGISHLLIIFLTSVVVSIFNARKLVPGGVRWPGKGWTLKSWYFTSFESVVRSAQLVDDFYYKFTKNGETFVLPTLLQSPDIIVPPSELTHLLKHPDSHLNMFSALRDQLQSDYTLHPCLRKHFYHLAVGGAVQLQNIALANIPTMANEVQQCLRSYLNQQSSSSWIDVPVFDLVEKVALQITTRFITGSEQLCRDSSYLNAASSFFRGVFVGAIFIRAVPDFLKPLLGPVLALPNRRSYKKCAQRLGPYISEKFETLRAGGDFKNNNSVQDMLQWYVSRSIKLPDQAEQTKELLTSRILLLGLASAEAPSGAATHMICDIYSYASSSSLIEDLRAEIQQVLGEEKGVWSLQALKKLVKMDSTIQESLRISAFGTRGTIRKVLKPEGIKLSTGLHIPQGSTITTPQWSIHRDHDIYHDAHTFIPYRFLDIAKKGDSKDTAKNDMTVTSTSFLAFGHGKHACPGRQFASVLLKLMLAHLIMEYDVQQLSERPYSPWIGGNYLPSTSARIQVRPRERTFERFSS